MTAFRIDSATLAILRMARDGRLNLTAGDQWQCDGETLNPAETLVARELLAGGLIRLNPPMAVADVTKTGFYQLIPPGR